MMYLMALLVLVYCKITQGVLEWTVVGKVTDYGQSVTLFCNVSHCCPDDAGWDRWTPVQQTLFIDIKTGRGDKKYDGKVLRDGYTLIIHNLTKDDLNVSYSCLYGVTLGERKFLQEEDVFSYPSNKKYNVPIDSSSQAAVKIIGITIGVVSVVGTVVGFLLYSKLRNKSLKDKNNRQRYSEPSINCPDKEPKDSEPSINCPDKAPKDSEPLINCPDKEPKDSEPLINCPDKEPKGETNSHMLQASDFNEKQDVVQDKHVSLNTTLIKGKTDTHSLQCSVTYEAIPSSVSTNDLADGKLVMVEHSGSLFQGKTDSQTLRSNGSQSSVLIDDHAEVKDVTNNCSPLKGRLFKEWPTYETYSLTKFDKNTKTQLMQNLLLDRIYDTDPKKQCRVLCILNENSKDKSVYKSRFFMDTELTCLQRMGDKLRWDLQTHQNKSSPEIIEILENETKQEFKSVRALFVIVVSSGDKYGIYGTTGRKIEYKEITNKFEKVSGLKDIPKIFILDFYDNESNILDHRDVPKDEVDSAKVQKRNRDTNICNESSSEKESNILDHREVSKDQVDHAKIQIKNRNTNICKESSSEKESNILINRDVPKDQVDHAKVQKQNRDTNICKESSSEKESYILDHTEVPKDRVMHAKIQKQNRDTIICEGSSSDKEIDIQDEGYTENAHQLERSTEEKTVIVQYSRLVKVSNPKLDMYICIATTLGRNDDIVKGSWVIGALLSVICEAGHYMTFKQMMKEVRIMVKEAKVHKGKPDQDIKTYDYLTKDFYLLPPSS